ncbi:unnamed protein product (macronuclear) [Paramecium tetraurelia]|uniref:Trichohyalin-plectin-homology domain-containing protein n=1 Tax=Paramecium tetraurelia TaxID=5888 RepID=A0DV45_PARTE|nr:uncharacterized protein GSPATT00020574001 [Paramecium tetraurelia]CAK86912.1 unnamed protein product [Paramecium tetraurelia]|eukprot:XP_001454309.1 hypothetical protein (macronuclear) [Paramecium tetraurelia strain d4-2]
MLPRISQSQQLHSLHYSEEVTLNEVKRRKKELELQAQSVENRIRQLRNEEGKLIKRIKQTEQLTSEVYQQKVAAHLKKQQKLQQNALYYRNSQNDSKDLIDQSIGNDRYRELYIKTTIERNQLKKVKQEFRQYKHDEAQNYRKLLQYEQFKFIEEQRKWQENQKLKAALRKQEQNLSEILIREKLNEKKIKIKQEQDQLKVKTIQENEEKEKHIKQLEIQELHIVQKLQATQQREKDVKGKLIAATRLQPEQFAKTFHSVNNTSLIAEQSNIQNNNKQDGYQQENQQTQSNNEQKEEQHNEGQQGTQTEE